MESTIGAISPFTAANELSIKTALQAHEKTLADLATTLSKQFPGANVERIKKYIQETRVNIDATIKSIRKKIQDLMTQGTEKQKKEQEAAEKAKEAAEKAQPKQPQEDKTKKEQDEKTKLLNSNIAKAFKDLDTQLLQKRGTTQPKIVQTKQGQPVIELVNNGDAIYYSFSQKTTPTASGLKRLATGGTTTKLNDKDALQVNTGLVTFLLLSNQTKTKYVAYAFMPGKTIYVTINQDLSITPQKNKSSLNILNPESATGMPLKDNVKESDYVKKIVQ